MSNDKKNIYAKLTLPEGKNINLPIIEGTIGPKVLDISSLYNETGMFTFDPGFTSTGSCQSKITYIDGDKGILLHRGYEIEYLASKKTFLETAFLLLYGELPNEEKKSKFVDAITTHTMLNEQISNFYKGFRDNAHPMAILCGVVGAMSAFYHDSTNINNKEERRIASYRLIAKMPTIAAMAYKFSIGQPFVYPNNKLKYSENFLNMLFSVPAEDFQINDVFADANTPWVKSGMSAINLSSTGSKINGSTATAIDHYGIKGADYALTKTANDTTNSAFQVDVTGFAADKCGTGNVGVINAVVYLDVRSLIGMPADTYTASIGIDFSIA